MYKAIVKRKVRGLFETLSRGDYPAALADVREDVHHVFPGDNAVGGERHSRDAMSRWFERVFVIFPKLEFEVHEVVVKGWPWNTVVMVKWVDRATTQDGQQTYWNDGAHFIRLRWGKATHIQAYLDTERVSEVCDRLAANGLEEAGAEPILD